MEIRILGSGFGVWGEGFRVKGLETRARFRIWKLGFWVQGLGCRVKGSGLRVWRLEQGLDIRV